MHSPNRDLNSGDSIAVGFTLAVLGAVTGAIIGAMAGFGTSTFQISYPELYRFEFAPEHHALIRSATLQGAFQVAKTSAAAGFVAGLLLWVIGVLAGNTFGELLDRVSATGRHVFATCFLWLIANMVCCALEVVSGWRVAEWNTAVQQSTLGAAFLLSVVSQAFVKMAVGRK